MESSVSGVENHAERQRAGQARVRGMQRIMPRSGPVWQKNKKGSAVQQGQAKDVKGELGCEPASAEDTSAGRADTSYVPI